MTGVEGLIDQLAESTPLSRQRSGQNPRRIFALWVLATTVYAAVIWAIFLHPRVDLMTKLTEPLFTAEIFMLICLALSAIYSAALLSFPDIYQSHSSLIAPFIFFAGFCAVLFLEWLRDVPPAPAPYGPECLTCIIVLSLAPALMLFYTIRRMASTQPASAGAAAVLAAFAISGLIQRIYEDTNSIRHLVIWHYAPMLAAAAIGVILGHKLLKW